MVCRRQITQYTNILRPRSTRDLSLVRNLANHKTSSIDDAVLRTKASAAWARKRAASSRIVFHGRAARALTVRFSFVEGHSRRAPGPRQASASVCGVSSAPRRLYAKKLSTCDFWALWLTGRETDAQRARASILDHWQSPAAPRVRLRPLAAYTQPAAHALLDAAFCCRQQVDQSNASNNEHLQQRDVTRNGPRQPLDPAR